ncbi:MAG: Lrp/AsnC family transcriptional regulator [Candidatus Firestonebacteria bacterium]
MNQTDKKILNEIQKEFPVSKFPYKTIGQKLGLTEQKVFNTVIKLKKQGMIRRIGAFFDKKKLNYASALIALKVEDKNVHKVAKIVNSYPEITHNYLRKDEYNIWFTCIASSTNDIKKIINSIQTKGKIKETLFLPAKKTFKLSAIFKV